MERYLWYKNTAESWTAGLPIGNGRLAAMLVNSKYCDVLCLNHENLWRGVFKDRECDVVHQNLESVRSLILEERYDEATRLANETLSGRGGISGTVSRIDAYQPAGELKFEFDEGLSERRLDIESGVAYSEREGINAEYLVHCRDNLIMCHMQGKINCRMEFSRVYDNACDEEIAVEDNKLFYACSFDGGISYGVEVAIETDGNYEEAEDGFEIFEATYLDTYINIGTDVLGKEDELKKYQIPQSDWESSKSRHCEKFSECMNRVELSLNTSESNLPTNERLENFRQGADDDGIIELFLNYGRYLLISSSICGIMPANLQGKWNYDIEPPWMCDYHFDINVQMNYWVAECGNLPECCDALFDYTDLFSSEQNTAARDIYNCRGMVFPLSGDCWGKSTNEAAGWDIWIGGAAWIAQHYQKHYEYNGDIEFLRNRAYPFFKKIAEFYEDYLIKDANGVYQIIPSQSPENSFSVDEELPVSLGMSSAMDVQLAYDALSYAIDAAKILKIDKCLADKWKEMRDNLPEFKIGSDGRLLEWNKEMPEREPGHRHLSHLYGIFPGEIFMAEDKKPQLEAGIKSLEYRLSKGGGHTGWSRAWVACLYSRIGRSEDLYEQISKLITDFTTDSMLDLHPPGIFQIDGNLGGAEAILQAIVQSYSGKIYMLKALPERWRTGSLTGVKTVGGHTVSVNWKDGRVQSINLCMGFSQKAIFVMPDGEEFEIVGEKGKLYSVNL